MSILALLQRHLLIAAAAIILFSLSLHAMPLSWSKSVKHRRSTKSSATEPPTLHPTAGNVHQTELDADGNRGGATTHNCMQECYGDNFTSLEVIYRELTRKPHPSFLLSEMAERLHREYFCKSISTVDVDIFCEDRNPQLAHIDTKNYVQEEILQYLNAGRSSGPTYEIEYNATHYPRYLVQVKCNNPTENCKITLEPAMPYLEKVNSSWLFRRNTDVAIGCRSC